MKCEVEIVNFTFHVLRFMLYAKSLSENSLETQTCLGNNLNKLRRPIGFRIGTNYLFKIEMRECEI